MKRARKIFALLFAIGVSLMVLDLIFLLFWGLVLHPDEINEPLSWNYIQAPLAIVELGLAALGGFGVIFTDFWLEGKKD